VGLEEGRIWSN